MTENNPSGSLTESQLIRRQIERINKLSGEIDREELNSSSGPQTWSHRYQAMVDELYTTVKPLLSDEEVENLEEKLEEFHDEKDFSKYDPFDRKKLSEKKKEIIVRKLAEKDVLYADRGESL